MSRPFGISEGAWADLEAFVGRGLSGEAAAVSGGSEAGTWPEAGHIIGGIGLYLGELELWNPRLGLVEAGGDDLVYRHVIDCLAAVYPLRRELGALMSAGAAPALRAADIGSGAGLPGLLLALVFPTVHWTLVEKQGRRAGFLINAAARMGLRNARVEQKALEDLGGADFHFLTARAFKPLEPGILGALDACLGPGGWMLHLKGRRDRIVEELATLDPARREAIRVEALAVPGLDQERHLVWVPRG